ncbi:MlaA family lipoprotein [Plastoroseomonas arctica]|uniref:VacJ family lipoprotein n=1 Tax=Plastoroseomonas arctica TaxID=1509237 RepID=A0AAF1KK51_9PROT|nr:VacJ family lipoprotein [Plastoroseomonas arctica]MBR0656265.1 VacJ family lipoprotein [Plastoroseomonas arctica]
MRLHTLLVIGLLAAAPAQAADDPLEAVNRRVHALNQVLHSHVFGPAAALYRTHTPAGVQQGIGNAIANIAEPVTAISAALAGEFGQAGNAAARFAINTTLGLGGVRDAAEAMGYPRAPMTLSDALCRWGVPSGPFLMLPLLGPSTLRDASALVATSTALAQGIGGDAVVALGLTEQLHDYAELHPSLERIGAESLDPYATYRSAYLQRRAASCPADAAAASED